MVYHKHHIIPKHMGGSDDSDNLVLVTVEEHTALHKQLWEDLGHQEDYIAWQALSGQISHAEAIILAVKAANTGRKVVFSEQHRQNLRKPKSAAARENMRKPKTEEHKRKLAEAARKRPPSVKQLAALRAQAERNKTQLSNPEFRDKMSHVNKENWRKRRAGQTA